MKTNFGDKVCIEHKRYDRTNEVYLYKVIGKFDSNTYVDIPIEQPIREKVHYKCDTVLACIRCGDLEKKIRRYKEKDVFAKR